MGKGNQRLMVEYGIRSMEGITSMSYYAKYDSIALTYSDVLGIERFYCNKYEMSL